MWRKNKITTKQYRQLFDHFQDNKSRIDLNTLGELTKVWIKTYKNRSNLSLNERMFLYGDNHPLQTLIREKVIDAVKIELIEKKDLLIAFKKNGSSHTGIILWKEKLQRNLPHPFSSEALEIPLTLFNSPHITFSNTTLIQKTKMALKKLDLIPENRGGAKTQRNNPLEMQINDLCVVLIEKNGKIPTASEISKLLYEKYENTDISTINKYLNRAIKYALPKVISSHLKGKRPK